MALTGTLDHLMHVTTSTLTETSIQRQVIYEVGKNIIYSANVIYLWYWISSTLMFTII
jgi:hypothetical protein